MALPPASQSTGPSTGDLLPEKNRPQCSVALACMVSGHEPAQSQRERRMRSRGAKRRCVRVTWRPHEGQWLPPDAAGDVAYTVIGWAFKNARRMLSLSCMGAPCYGVFFSLRSSLLWPDGSSPLVLRRTEWQRGLSDLPSPALLRWLLGGSLTCDIA